MRKRIDISLDEKTIMELKKVSKEKGISVSRILEGKFKRPLRQIGPFKWECQTCGTIVELREAKP